MYGLSRSQAGLLGGSRNPAAEVDVYSGETEKRGMWMFSPGETPDARKVFYPGRDYRRTEDGCFPDELNYCVYWINVLLNYYCI